MMTTKVFQRVLAIFLVVAAIFLANGLTNVANAARVQLYDGKVNDIINDIRKIENNIKRYKEDAEFRDYMIKGLKEKGFSDIQIKESMSIDLKLRGTHYYTGTDGFRYCESYFGDNDKNRLVFKVNNDGAVSSAWVIFPLYTLAGEDNDEGSKTAGLLLESVTDVSGLSDDECFNLMNQFLAYLNYWYNNLKPGERPQLYKIFSVWCTESKRYIDLEVSGVNYNSDNPSFNLFIYAHI